MAGQQSLAAQTWTTVAYDTVEFSNITGILGGTSGHDIVIPAGVNRAEIVASTGITSTDHTGGLVATIRRNSSNVATRSRSDSHGRLTVSSGVIAVTQGDTIRVRLWSNAAKVFGNSWLKPHMSIKMWNE